MPDYEESEWQTRKKRIDTRLRALGWSVTPVRDNKPLQFYSQSAIEEFPTTYGPADYALCLNGQIIGIVEAKKLSLGPQNVLIQAERYARGLAEGPFQFGELRAPFLYSTNGEVIWFHDVRHPRSRSRRIAGFHTPQGLQELLSRDFETACEQVRALPNTHRFLRPYQPTPPWNKRSAIVNGKCWSRWQRGPARPSRWSTKSTA